MTRPASLLAACLSALLSLPLSGCEKGAAASKVPAEDPVDRATQALLDALAVGDREQVVALCSPALAAELDERSVALLARTLTWLGPLTALDPGADEQLVGGLTRQYRVGFDRGELGLTVSFVDGKVEGFEFDEDQWQALSERASEASVGSLRVAEFGFIDPAGGGPLTGPLDPTEIRYRLALEGLDAQLREHHVVVAKVVLDGEGNEVYRQRRDDDIRFPQAETGSNGGHVEGGVAVPGPGSYELELKITDLIAGQAIVHRVPIQID